MNEEYYPTSREQIAARQAASTGKEWRTGRGGGLENCRVYGPNNELIANTREASDATQIVHDHNVRSTQPAPAPGGEWRTEAMPTHGWRVVDATGQEIVADVYRKEDAEQIVSDHRAVPLLTDALIQARNNAQVFTGAQYLSTAVQGLGEIVKQIDAALAAVGREEEQR
jgi:hypothetical protein